MRKERDKGPCEALSRDRPRLFLFSCRRGPPLLRFGVPPPAIRERRKGTRSERRRDRMTTRRSLFPHSLWSLGHHSPGSFTVILFLLSFAPLVVLRSLRSLIHSLRSLINAVGERPTIGGLSRKHGVTGSPCGRSPPLPSASRSLRSLVWPLRDVKRPTGSCLRRVVGGRRDRERNVERGQWNKSGE